MDKIGVGFIGTGAMGRNHIKIVAEKFNDIAKIVGICDANDQELMIAREMCRGEVLCFSDYKEMLKEKNIQAVFISLPNFLHADVAIAALKAGKDVFCEKPIATKVEDVYRMLEAKEKTGNILMIGLELRYADYYKKIKTLIDTGSIGKPVLAWCKEFRGPFLPKVNNWIQDRDRSGGALVDKNSHHFDLMTWFLGVKPLRVCAFGGTNVVRVINTDNEVEDNACVIVEYEGGFRASLVLCMFAPDTADYGLELGVIGDKGRLETEESTGTLHLWLREKPEDIKWKHRMPEFIRKSEHIIYHIPRIQDEGGHSGFLQIHRAFFDAIQKRKKPLTTIENVIYSTLIPLAAEESMKTGRIVEVG